MSSQRDDSVEDTDEGACAALARVALNQHLLGIVVVAAGEIFDLLLEELGDFQDELMEGELCGNLDVQLLWPALKMVMLEEAFLVLFNFGILMLQCDEEHALIKEL